MSKLFTILLTLLVMTTANAQTAEKDTTLERVKIRTSFAKSYFGIDAFSTSGGTTQYATPTGLQTVSFSGTTSPRILLGGTHFWGHADFYVAIPVARLGSQAPAGLKSVFYGEGVETGFRAFPWAVEPGKLRPFVGMSLKGAAFGQVNNEPTKTYKTVPSVARTIFPYQAGLVYAGKKFLLQAGAYYQPKSDYQYPISRTEYAAVKISLWSFNVGMSYWINTNGGLASKSGVN